MKFLERFRRFRFAIYWPVAAIGVLCLSCWIFQQHQDSVKRAVALQSLLADYTASAEEQAGVAFGAGDFRHAAALLAPVAACPDASPATQLLQARTYECLGRYADAVQVYCRLETLPSMKVDTLRGKKFAQRMASERSPATGGSPETLYRLHAELMQRGDFVTARNIARKLLPDTEPLRASTIALLRQSDSTAEVTPSAETGRLDVTLHHLAPKILALLQDLKIGTLSVAHSTLETPKILAAVDAHALDLSYNGLSDLAGIRALPLRRLQLNETRVADLRPLAGMPLKELNLTQTMVSNLGALAMCPLEKLNLASTAVRSLEPLRGLELRELDLSHTRVTDLAPLSGMPLEKLVLTDTEIHNLKPLAGARLKSLSLAGTAVKDLSVLATMPLVELDLRGCELLGDTDSLASCPTLECVYLPRHVKVPEDHWGLPHLRIVQTEQRRIAVALQ